MKFLVCREDAIRPAGQMRSSNHFPMIVESYDLSAEAIVRKALYSVRAGYIGYYSYVVVPLENAKVVTFNKPRPTYEVEVNDYGN